MILKEKKHIYIYICIIIIKSGDFVGERLGPLVKIALL